jgi:hypothetical protein
VIGGSACVVGPPPASLGRELFVVLVGVVPVDVALVGVVCSGVVCSGIACSGVAAGAGDGGGAETGAPSGGLEAVVEGEIATTIGAAAPLGSAGLTAEPTSTPKASNAITATAAAQGAGIGTSPTPSVSESVLQRAAIVEQCPAALCTRCEETDRRISMPVTDSSQILDIAPPILRFMPEPADLATAELKPSPIRTGERCAACGAAMASDQRYCVECGERRGPARVPLLDGLAQRARETPTASRSPGRPRMSVNSTLIAGVGTLLLAMGIGVLIGRSGNNTSAKSPPVQVVTVAGAGGAASSGAASTAPSTAASPSATATKSGGATTSSATSTAKSKSTPKKSTAAPPKVVKVGSAGKGPGYQKGHFTGNFFGEGEK